MLKKCLFCGIEYNGHFNSKYCKNEHTKKCCICDKVYIIKNPNRPQKTCSQSCGSSLSHSKESKRRRKENCFKKYGVEFTTQVDSIKKKSLDTQRKNNNGKLAFNSEKQKNTMLKKYGVENISQLEETKENKKKTWLKNWGVDNPMKSNDIKENFKKSFIEKYNVPYPSQISITNYKDWINLETYIKNNSHKTLSEHLEHFSISIVHFRKIIRSLNLDNLIEDFYVNSRKENEILKTINQLEVNYDFNNRKLIYPKEVDFYFPEHSFAIEVSPTRTHNSIIGYMNGNGKSKDYHQNKFKMCEKKNVELMTIFDWHDWNKCLDMIKSKLSKNKIIYARKCTYEETILNKNLRKLFNDWHILNLANNIPNGPVSILKYNNDIAGLALWKHNKKEVELKRLVFKPNFTIQGGASKLIKNYMRNNNIDEIFTYSDNDLGVGNVYKTLGFDLIEESQPGLNFYNEKYDWHIKNLSLVMQGADRLLKNYPNYTPVGLETEETGPLPTNQEIVMSYGFLPVYDCGYKKWKFKL